jgi:hypothetical protein
MTNKSTLKIKCETQDLRDTMMQILLMTKSQLEQHISLLLERKGIVSDTKIVIQDGEMTITSSTPPRGAVLTSDGITMTVTEHSAIPDDSKYIYVEGGAVKIFLKRADGIDRVIAQFETLNEAVTNIHSNDVEAVVNNILNPSEPVLLNGDSTETNENGDIEATVQSV